MKSRSNPPRSSDTKTQEEILRYHALVDSMNEGFGVVNLDTKFVYVNRRLCEMLGYSAEEILGRDVHEFVDKRNSGLLDKHLTKRAKGLASRYELDWTTKAGTVLSSIVSGAPLVDARGVRQGSFAVVCDITERRMMEDSSKKSEAKYRALAEQSSQGMMIIGDKGFVYVNKAFAQMVGFSVDELMKMNMIEIWDLIHPEDQPVVITHLQNLFARRAVPPRYQYRLVRKDGETCWVEAFSSPIDYEGNQAIQTMIVDVTERLKVERATDVTKDRASFYLDLMGHDLKNQLQVVVNSAALLRFAQDDRGKSSLLEVIENAVQRCSRLIEEVRATEQLMSIPLSERPLIAALKGCVQALSGRVSDAVFEAAYDLEDAWVYADDYLELLLSNLLVNAVEHNPSSNKHVWVSLKDEDQSYLVSIADNGPGIPDSSKAILFDLARRFGGMGLHQSYQIVEKYGGKIEIVDRVPGHEEMGAEFRIWLPKASKTN
jgi:PAS domain S-box-containing protein